MHINNRFLGTMNSLSHSPLQQTPHDIFHLCVSHCVNDRISHGSEDCKEHSHEFVHRVGDHRTHIGEYTGTKKGTTTVKWEPRVERALCHASEPWDFRECRITV